MQKDISVQTITPPQLRQLEAFSRAVRPADFRAAYQKALKGEPSKLFAILDFFYRLDDEVISSMVSLQSAVLSNGVQFVPVDGSSDAGEKQAAIFKDLFDDLDMNNHLEHLLDSHFYGITACYVTESDWSVRSINGTMVQAPAKLSHVPHHWIYGKSVDKKMLLHIGSEPYQDPKDGTLICSISGKVSSDTDIDFTALGRGLGAMMHAVYKYYTDSDWSAFLEMFGMPLIIGKTGLNGDQATVKRAVEEMQHASKAVLGENDSIEIISAKGSTGSSDIFDRRIDRANRAIAKLLKCESLTNNMGSVGSYAASKTTNGIRLDVAQALAKKLADTLHRQFVKPLAERNFSKCLVNTRIPVKAAENLFDMVKVHEKLHGLIDLSEAQIRDQYKVNKPIDDQDTIYKRSNSFLG